MRLAVAVRHGPGRRGRRARRSSASWWLALGDSPTPPVDSAFLAVLVMKCVNTPVATAYIALENDDAPIRYSGYVEQIDGRLQFSPVFDALVDAVAWARERTDVVIARDVVGGYQWYGPDPHPVTLRHRPNDTNPILSIQAVDLRRSFVVTPAPRKARR